MSFEVEKGKREYVIEQIAKKLPEEKKQEVADLVNLYIGNDKLALTVLSYAAEKGKLKETIKKMRDYHKNNGEKIPEFLANTLGNLL